MPEIGTEIEEKPLEKPIKKGDLKRPMDKEAEKIREKTTLPKAPGDEITDKEWDQWARLLDESMWNKITMYVYRRKPKIIRQLSNPSNKNYIDKLGKCVDIREYLKKTHGGGNYYIQVVGTSGDRKITNINVEIPFPNEAEPILDYSELDVNAQENMGYVNYLRNKGIIDDRGKPVSNQPIAPAAPSITGNDVLGIIDRVAKLNSDQQAVLISKLMEKKDDGLGGQIGAILLQQMKSNSEQNDPAKFITMFKEAKSVLGPGESKSELAMIMPIFQMMMTQAQENTKLVVEAMKSSQKPTQAGDSMVNTVDSLLNIVEKLDSLRGGGGGDKSTIDHVIDGVERIGLPALQYFTQIYGIAKSGAALANPAGIGATGAIKPHQVGQNPKAITTGDIARQNAAEASRQKPAMATPQDINGVVQPEVAMDPAIAEVQQIMQQTGGIIIKFIADDKDGVELAVSLVELYGKPAWANVARYGEQKLFEGIRNFPEMWTQLESVIPVDTEGRVKMFINEFIHYEELMNEEGDIEDATAVAETAKPRVVKSGAKGGRTS